MTWLQTYTGKRFIIDQPEPDQIDIVDIAHSLAMQCRFNGHCTRFYSVAEHSIHVAACIRARVSTAPEMQLLGLMHDAAEAYVGDVVRPLKNGLADYRRIENNIQRVIMQKFGLMYPLPEVIKQADNNMLVLEHEQIMVIQPYDWDVMPEPFYRGVTIIGWDPREAEMNFLETFHELNG